jgi:hypothetical protein
VSILDQQEVKKARFGPRERQQKVREPRDEARVMASTAPRGSRQPGSPEWCYQTTNLLASMWRELHLDRERFMEYLIEIRRYQAWEKIPVHAPYGTEAAMLAAELGFEGDIDKEIDRRMVREQIREKQREDWAARIEAGESLREIARDEGVDHKTVAARVGRNESYNEQNSPPQKRQVVGYRITHYTQPATAAQKIRQTFGDAWALELAAAINAGH